LFSVNRLPKTYLTMASTRFFLADLPDRTVEADLHSLFQDYGYVEHVDLKRKEQDGVTKVIAFVTLQTDDAQYCELAR